MPIRADGTEYTLSGPTWEEPYRAATDAQEILRQTCPRGEMNVEAIKERLAAIAKTLGKEGADYLMDEMRRQWANRKEWMK